MGFADEVLSIQLARLQTAPSGSSADAQAQPAQGGGRRESRGGNSSVATGPAAGLSPEYPP